MSFLFIKMFHFLKKTNIVQKVGTKRVRFYKGEFSEFLLHKVLLPQFLPYSEQRPILVSVCARHIYIVLVVIFYLLACVNLALFNPFSLLILSAGLHFHTSSDIL